jgi:hypothetical protein
MAEILAGIEQFALVRALKASFIAYPIVNALHIISVGVLLTSVTFMDLRIVGVFRSVPQAPFVTLLRRAALFAFAAAVITGLLLFSVRAGEYAAKPVFLAKMTLILAAGANFLAFALISHNRGGEPAGAAVRVQAILSLLLWLCVPFAGRLIGFL